METFMIRKENSWCKNKHQHNKGNLLLSDLPVEILTEGVVKAKHAKVCSWMTSKWLSWGCFQVSYTYSETSFFICEEQLFTFFPAMPQMYRFQPHWNADSRSITSLNIPTEKAWTKIFLWLLLSPSYWPLLTDLHYTEASQHATECWLQLLVSPPPYIFAARVTSPRVIFTASKRMSDMHDMKNWISCPRLMYKITNMTIALVVLSDFWSSCWGVRRRELLFVRV